LDKKEYLDGGEWWLTLRKPLARFDETVAASMPLPMGFSTPTPTIVMTTADTMETNAATVDSSGQHWLVGF